MAVQWITSTSTSAATVTLPSSLNLQRVGTKRNSSSEGSTTPSKRARISPKVPNHGLGHCPVELNTFISGRYFVLRKAGQGSFAIVWICWDIQECRFVALKISRSDHETRKAALREETIYDHLYRRHKHPQHIIRCFGAFTVQREGHSYVCLVFEMMAHTLLHLTGGKHGIPVADVRRTIKNVLLGLEMLHECGIVHTDVKPENVLISMTEEAEEALAYEVINVFRKMPHAKAHIRSLREHIRTMKASDVTVKLADLGSAQLVDNLNYDVVITTAPYRSFEALMCGPWSTKTDIWSVGCMAFELATGRLLMPVGGKQEHMHLNWMISRLGMPPQHLRYNPHHFDEQGGRRDGSHLAKHSVKPEKIVVSSEQRFDMKAAESFASFVNSMLEFDPDDRPTATRCLEHPFMSHLPQ